MLRRVRSSRVVLWIAAAFSAIAAGRFLRRRSQAASAPGPGPVMPTVPVVPVVQPEVVEVGDVQAPGEPPIEDAGEPAKKAPPVKKAPPAKKAGAKKAAAKKAPPEKKAPPAAP